MSRTKGVILGALLAIILFFIGYCLWEHLGLKVRENNPRPSTVLENNISNVKKARKSPRREHKQKRKQREVAGEALKVLEPIPHISITEKAITRIPVREYIKIEERVK